MIKLKDYVCGGYFLARLLVAGVERPRSVRLPARYFSASSCLCDFFTDSWVWNNAGPMDSAGNFINGIYDFENRLARAKRFGITVEQLPEVIRWGQTRGGRDFGFPRGYYRLCDAWRATEWITLPADAFVIFGIGMHRSLTRKFLQDTNNEQDHTVPYCIREDQELSPEGAALGHELLSTELGQPAHSWICGGLEEDYAKRLQFTLNQYGYIESFETALKCTHSIERPGFGAEPGPWYPWLMVRYH